MSEQKYDVKCPVCKKVIGEFTGTTGGQGEAMICQEYRGEHSRESRQCIGQPGWEMGWLLEPVTGSEVEVEDVPQAAVGGPVCGPTT